MPAQAATRPHLAHALKLGPLAGADAVPHLGRTKVQVVDAEQVSVLLQVGKKMGGGVQPNQRGMRRKADCKSKGEGRLQVSEAGGKQTPG
jgi:hypothetical protein